MGQKNSFHVANGSDFIVWVKIDTTVPAVSLPNYRLGLPSTYDYATYARHNQFIRIAKATSAEFKASPIPPVAFITIVSASGRVICHGRLLNLRTNGLIIDSKDRLLEPNFGCVWLDKSGRSHSAMDTTGQLTFVQTCANLSVIALIGYIKPRRSNLSMNLQRSSGDKMGANTSVHIANGFSDSLWIKVTERKEDNNIPHGCYRTSGFQRLYANQCVKVERSHYATIISGSGRVICKGKSLAKGIIVDAEGNIRTPQYGATWTDEFGRGHEFQF